MIIYNCKATYNNYWHAIVKQIVTGEFCSGHKTTQGQMGWCLGSWDWVIQKPVDLTRDLWVTGGAISLWLRVIHWLIASVTLSAHERQLSSAGGINSGSSPSSLWCFPWKKIKYMQGCAPVGSICLGIYWLHPRREFSIFINLWPQFVRVLT